MVAQGKPKRKNEMAEQVCSFCGGTDFEWGTVYHAWYRPPKSSIWSAGQPLEARRCVTCGNVQQFAEGSDASGKMQGVVLTLLIVFLAGLFLCVLLGIVFGTALR